MQEPVGAVALYQKILSKYTNIIRAIVNEELLTKLPALVALNEAEKKKVDATRNDQVAELLAQLLRATRLRIARDLPDQAIEEALGVVGKQLEGFNRRQVGKVFKSVLGIDILDNPNSELAITKFIQENLQLVKNVGEGFLTEAQSEIFSGFRRGARASAIAENLIGAAEGEEEFRGRFKKAETRAQLIARDQINKLNGELAELRQTAVGVTRYIWRTSLDDRVRPEHEEREGQIFEWANPPPDGHPGEAINCRCSAEPVLEDLVI